MTAEQIEALGKAGGAIAAILVLGWIFNTWISQSVIRQNDLIERQTAAIERMVAIYSGEF